MSSERQGGGAYVWVWLPGEIDAVVAGKLSTDGEQILFNYGRSYLARANAMALAVPELPLQAGHMAPRTGLHLPGCIRDVAPDSWGRRVQLHVRSAGQRNGAALASLDELSLLMTSGSDRPGALDFQSRPDRYRPRELRSPPLRDLVYAAECIEQGKALGAEAGRSMLYSATLGGSRAKVLYQQGRRKYIAKLASRDDLYSVVKAEYIAMRLAGLCGLNVAPVSLTRVLQKDVLLVERFDRLRSASGWQRRSMLSALTLLELDESMASHASYESLARVIRYRFADAAGALRELFSRLVFNILCGNSDDHARNHSAFWDGATLELTPAYDICPQPRNTPEAYQSMYIAAHERRSRLSSCLSAAACFQLKKEEAIAIVERQISTIFDHWDSVCDEAGLSRTERSFLWGRQFLNPFAFENLDQQAAGLKVMAEFARNAELTA